MVCYSGHRSGLTGATLSEMQIETLMVSKFGISVFHCYYDLIFHILLTSHMVVLTSSNFRKFSLIQKFRVCRMSKLFNLLFIITWANRTISSLWSVFIFNWTLLFNLCVPASFCISKYSRMLVPFVCNRIWNMRLSQFCSFCICKLFSVALEFGFCLTTFNLKFSMIFREIWKFQFSI